MKKLLFIITIICFASGSFAAVQTDKELFETKCGTCHSLKRSLRKTKGLKAWKRTVKRMARYKRADFSAAEGQKIADFLAQGSKPKKPAPVKAVKEETDRAGEHEMFAFNRVRVNQFIDPSVCAECHQEQFKQWNGSMHSKAFYDPIWRKATKLFHKQASTGNEILEMKACVKCHTPLGFRSYLISSPGDDYDKLAQLPSQGIFCNWCHNIDEFKHIGDASYEVKPGGGEDEPSTMLGPFEDAASDFHPTKYSELHTRSEFCGLCHNVSHAANKLPFEQTYSEWKNSPYNTGNQDTTVTCQDCHMRQRPGIPATGKTARPDNPGKAAGNGPERDHIWTHYFVGANTITTKLLGGDVHAQMAVERLKQAADLELIKDSVKKSGLSQIKIKVINSGAGHYLPTGITEVRQMWLSVLVTDVVGSTIFRSGYLDKNGDLDEGAVLYYTQLGNDKGQPVLNVALADRILHDRRIPPKGFLIEKYVFQVPADVVPPFTVTATLKYRSVSQSLARLLLGEKTPEIPVVDMAGLVEKINF